MEYNKANDMFDAAFRIIGDDLDPDYISSLLGITPDHSHRKGENNTRKTDSGKIILGPRYKTGLWNINSSLDETSSLEEHLISILDRIENVGDKVAQLSVEGYRVDIFCGYFFYHGANGGFDLSPEILGRMSKLRINLAISVNEM
jgi:hypothetical protein